MELSTELIGPSLEGVRRQVNELAMLDSALLILGPSGGGKEIVARAIHAKSSRSARPFLPVNCATLPDSLADSELFGHEREAFTGATGMKLGLLETAGDGSIFLDEIGESEQVQAKLLRAIQVGRIMRVGATVEIPIHCRILAATNRSEKEIRNDLLHRFGDIVRIPPLSERCGDIPELVESIRIRLGAKYPVSREALRLFMKYEWPGNVRELENVMSRLPLDRAAGPDDLDERFQVVIPRVLGTPENRKKTKKIWLQTRSKTETARLMKIDRTTVHKWLRVEK